MVCVGIKFVIVGKILEKKQQIVTSWEAADAEKLVTGGEWQVDGGYQGKEVIHVYS